MLTAPSPTPPRSEEAIKRTRVRFLGAFAFLLVLAILAFALVSIFCPGPYRYSSDAKVLLYHLVADETYGENEYLFVRVSDFEAQLAAIQASELPSAFADDPGCYGERPCVILTFDDGYESVYTTAFPLLKKYNIRATVFLASDLIGMPNHLTVEQIREMEASGLVRFGSHTLTHRKLSGLSPEEVQNELLLSRERLEEILGHPVSAIAYPEGSYTKDIGKQVLACGYLYAYTTDVPKKAYYANTALPRYYVTREMTLDDFMKILP